MNHYSPKELLEVMLSHLGIIAEVTEETRPSGLTLHIIGNEARFLIGEDGELMEDLQYLLNRMVSIDEQDHQRIALDINSHRLNEQSRFLEEIKKTVEHVRTTGTEITLDPMNSFERMIVHNTYKNDPEIETSSPSGPDRIKQITVRRRK
ncbi:MAG: protein jag [Candidatus Methylacidiphilales bacterium]